MKLMKRFKEFFLKNEKEYEAIVIMLQQERNDAYLTSPSITMIRPVASPRLQRHSAA